MPYKTQSPDTSRLVEERQIAFFRRMGINGRLAYGAEMIDEGFEAVWANFRRLNPDLTPFELRLKWVAHHFGEEFAQRYKQHLECKTKNLPPKTKS